jgi:hypothetical protein
VLHTIPTVSEKAKWRRLMILGGDVVGRCSVLKKYGMFHLGWTDEGGRLPLLDHAVAAWHELSIFPSLPVPSTLRNLPRLNSSWDGRTCAYSI